MSTPSTAKPVVARKGGMLRNIFHLSLGQVATTVIAILLSAAVARTLGAADFGLLYIVMTIGTFAYVFVDWGHLPYATREIARHHERAGELIGSILVVRVLTALAVCIPIAITTPLLGYDLRTTVYAVIEIVAWLPGYMAMSFSAAFRGHERMDYEAAITVALKLTGLMSAFVVLALGGRVLGLILISLPPGLVTLAVAATLYRKLHLPALRATKATAYELLRDGAPMLAFAVTVAAQPYLNAAVLNWLTPPEVVGWYGVTWAIAGTLVAPAGILGTSMYPRLSKVAHDPAELKHVLRFAFRPLLLIGVLGAVGTYLFASFAIDLVYGANRYGPAADTLKAFAPALLLMYVDTLLAWVLFSMNRAGQLAWTKTAAIVVTTAVSFALTGWFQARYGNGGIGAMFGQAIGEIIMLVTMTILVRNVLDRRMVTDAIRALASGVLTIGVMRQLSFLNPLLAIPACIAVFCGLSFVVGAMDRSDLNTLLASVRRTDPGSTAAVPTTGGSL